MELGLGPGNSAEARVCGRVRVTDSGPSTRKQVEELDLSLLLGPGNSAEARVCGRVRVLEMDLGIEFGPSGAKSSLINWTHIKYWFINTR